jgi:hypothetical protein
MRRSIGPIGLPDPAVALPQPTGCTGHPAGSLAFAVFLAPPSPTRCRAGIILSCAWRPLQSASVRFRSTATLPPRRSPSMRFRSPSRHPPAESTFAVLHPGPLRSALDVSHVLDGLLLCRSRGFVSPRSHVRDSLSRGFASRSAVRARRSPWPPRRYEVPPAVGRPTTQPHHARPRGRARCENPSRRASG